MARFSPTRFKPPRYHPNKWGGSGGEVFITATLTPSMSRLYDGQTVQDVTNWSTFIDTANYSSTASGTIASATPAFTGDAIAADDALVEDETAGFTVTVTDGAANQRVFTAAAITVEYKLNFTQTEANEGDIDVNPIVGDAVALGDIVVGSGPYAATYSGITAGDVRGGPYNFGDANTAGLPQITYSGLEADLTVDDVLTALDGFWTTTTGNLTFSYQWQSDGVNISGATNSTFTITADEQGTDVTVEVTADDGVNSTVMAESAAVSVPAAASPAVVTSVLGPTYSSYTGANPITDTIPAGAAAADKEVYLLVNWQQIGGPALTVEIGGATPTEVATTVGVSNTDACAAVYRIAAPAGGNLALSIDVATGQDFRGCSYQVYTVTGRTSETGVFDYDAFYGALDLSANVLTGDTVLATASMRISNTTGDFTPTNLTGATGETFSGRRGGFYSATILSDATPLTMLLTPTGDGSTEVAAAGVVIH